MNQFLHIPRRLALWAISILTALATVASLTESYHALWLWAAQHQEYGTWGAIWPLQIDVFILIGELALFVGLVDLWHHRKRVFPWAVALAGLSVSVAANVGHVTGHTWTTRLTAAVPPLAAYASLVVGMGVLKRVSDLYASKQPEPETVSPEAVEEVPEPEPLPVVEAVEAPPAVPQGFTESPAISPAPRPTISTPFPVVRDQATQEFAGELEQGVVPAEEDIVRRVGVGTVRAKQIQSHLAGLVTAVDTDLGTTVPDPERSNDVETGTFTTLGHPGPGQIAQSYQSLPVSDERRR